MSSNAITKKRKPSYTLKVKEVDVDRLVFDANWYQSPDPNNSSFGMGCNLNYLGGEKKEPGHIKITGPVMTVAFRFSLAKPTDTEDKMTIALTNKHVHLLSDDGELRERKYEIMAMDPPLTPDQLVCASKVLELFELCNKISVKGYDHTALLRDKKGKVELFVKYKPLVRHYQDKAKEYPPQDQLILGVNSWTPEIKGSPGMKGPMEITTAFFEMTGGNRKNCKKLTWAEAKELFIQGAEVVPEFTFNRIWEGSNAVSIKARVTKLTLVKRGTIRTKEVNPDIDDDVFIPEYAAMPSEEVHDEQDDHDHAAAEEEEENQNKRPRVE